MQVPVEVFDIFFGSFMKKKSVINLQEFSDLISQAEDKLFSMADDQVKEVDL